MTVVPYKNVKRPIVPVGDLPMLALFARGEQGAWYDPSDLATMFQDAAGTIPVTGVEQPVGLILDKSGNGNHASQLTTTARPMLSARHNLLNSNGSLSTDMETLAGTAGVTLAQMDGFRSAVRFPTESSTTVYAYRPYTLNEAGDYTFSFYVEMDDPGPPVFGGTGTATADICLNAVGVVGKIPEHIIHVRDNIYRCIATVNVTTTGVKQCGPINYTYNAKRGFKVSGFQLERGSVASKYQRVSTLTDYDWQGWPLYLRFDGVDDFIQSETPYIEADASEWTFGSAESHGAPTFGGGSANAFVQTASSASLSRISTRFNLPVENRDVWWERAGYVASTNRRWIVRRDDSGLFDGLHLPVTREASDWGSFSNGLDRIGSRGVASFFRSGGIHNLIAITRNITQSEMVSVDKFFSEKMKVPA